MGSHSLSKRVGARRRRGRANGRNSNWQVEPLEPRTLLAFGPIGQEMAFGSFVGKTGAVASDAGGDSVVVSGDYQYLAQLVGSAGSLGNSVLVNPTKPSSPLAESRPTAAMDADGDFAVAWPGYNSPPQYATHSEFDFRAFSAAGVPRFPEFEVKKDTLTFNPNNYNENPSLAMDAAGDGVVVCQASIGGSVWHIDARPFTAKGPIGFSRVDPANTNTSDTNPAVAMAADGSFVVAWQASASVIGPSNSVDVYFQRYSATFAKLGAPVLVNTYTDGAQGDPAVAMDYAGDFVIAWTSQDVTDTAKGQDGSGAGVFARRFNAAGVAQGGEFRVNTTTTDDQAHPCVAADADGDFVVAWDSINQDGDQSGIYAQRYSATGTALGAEFRVNATTAGSQTNPTVAMDASHLAIFGWKNSPDFAFHVQRFDFGPDTAGPMATDLNVAGVPVARNGTVFRPATQLAVNFTEPLSTTGGATGATSVLNPANFHVVYDGVVLGNPPVIPQPSSVAFGRNPQTNKYEATLNFSTPLTLSGPYRLIVHSSLRDPAGNALDGDRDGTPGGGNVEYPFNLAEPPPPPPPPPNKPPTTLGIPGVTVLEDEADTVIPLRDAFNDDQPTSDLTFSLTVSKTKGLFSALSINPADGTLTIGYAPDASGQATVFVKATDAGGLSATSNFTVTVKPVNDPPVNTVPGEQTAAAGQGIVFSQSNGNAISVSDIDAGASPVLVTLVAGRGYTLQPAQTTGLTVLSTGTTLQFSGTVSDVNAALDGLRLVPPATVPTGNSSVRITVDDQGNTGVGGPLADTDLVPVAIVFSGIVLSVEDVTVTEGNSGTTEAIFIVSLAGRQTDPVSVDYATADGTATAAGGDYVSKAGTLVFDGERSKSITVLVNGDTAVEPDEQFFLNLSNAKDALVSDGHAVGTIVNDDYSGPPAFSISDAGSITEGDAGTTNATFTVTLAAPSSSRLSVDYATGDGTAASFVGGANQLVDGGFEPPGVTQAVYTAGQKVGAWTVESGAVFPAQGYQTPDGSQQVLDLHAGAPGSIYQDVATVAGQPYMLRFALAGNPSTPNLKQLQVSFDGVPIATESFDTTGRSFSDMGWVSKAYVVVPTSNVSRLRFASQTAGAAGPIIDAVTLVGMGDYDRRSGTLTFAPGVTSQTITVPVEGDTMDERDENFYVNLSNPQGGPVPITRGSATAVILDDDDPPMVSVSDASVTEGNSGTTQMTFTLTLSAPSGKTTAVSIGASNGTAQAGVDFGGPGGSIVFVSGETSKTVNVGVFGDTTPEPDESFYFVLSSPFELAIGDGTGVGTIVNDDGALEGPRVAQVYVAASAWSPAYKQVLQANGQGDATFGYAVPAAAQLAVLPWGDLNQFSIRFDRDVLVGADDLTLAGVKTLAKKISSFRYDRATHTATWTLTQPLRDAALTLELDGDPGGVMDAAKKAPLDGEWTVGAKKYPSGNGTAGGDFRFALNVLAGDVDGNGAVNIRDTLRQRRRPASSVEKPGTGPLAYDPMADLNGDGAINAADMDVIRSNLMRSLPATGSSPTAALRQSWSVLGTTHTGPS